MHPIQNTKLIFLQGGYLLYEAFSAVVLLYSSLLLFNPFTRIFDNRSTKLLALFVSENELATVFLILGLATAYALYTFKLPYRRFAMLAHAILWGVVFVMMVASNPAGWFPPLLATNSLFCAIVFARMTHDIYG